MLIFDSQDSFTFNIVERLRQAGINDVKVTADHPHLEEEAADYSHVILGPGPGLPEDHPGLFRLLSALRDDQSVLGICLGHEALAVHAGARIMQLDRVFHGDEAQVFPVATEHLFSGIGGAFKAGLYHSWIVDEASLPGELLITCRSERQLIMGLQHRYLPRFGFQFHPESYRTPVGLRLLTNWLELKF